MVICCFLNSGVFLKTLPDKPLRNFFGGDLSASRSPFGGVCIFFSNETLVGVFINRLPSYADEAFQWIYRLCVKDGQEI